MVWKVFQESYSSSTLSAATAAGCILYHSLTTLKTTSSTFLYSKV